jgi:chemotaxis protein MotB
MAKRPTKQSASVPEWIVTFGDMMSLLLCFFILLAAFSEIKKDEEFQRVITAVNEAFGYSGGVGFMPVDDPPLRSMIQILEALAVKNLKEPDISESPDKAIEGRQTRVSQVRDGLMFTIGGALTFDPGSAELKPGMKAELSRIARILRGRDNKIEVRGHAAKKVLPPGSAFKDLRDLSYARAKAVAEYLMHEGAIPAERFVVDARGDTEPQAPRKYSDDAQGDNRRVEIVMTEVTVEQLSPDATYSSESSARGE